MVVAVSICQGQSAVAVQQELPRRSVTRGAQEILFRINQGHFHLVWLSLPTKVMSRSPFANKKRSFASAQSDVFLRFSFDSHSKANEPQTEPSDTPGVWSRSCDSERHPGWCWLLGMCVAAFFGPKKKHRSVTSKIFLPDMFLRCETRKHWTLRNVDGCRFCATRRKKGTALHDGVGSSMFFFFK